MFKKFRPHGCTPAFAGEGLFESPLFESPFFENRRGWGKGGFGEWGDEPRTRRGDMKFILLSVLAEQPKHGYEIIKELETQRGGFRRLSPGSVYPTLQMLEEGGYLTSEQTEGKRVYSITDSGRELLRDRNEQAGSATREGFAANRPTELIELRRTLSELNDAVAQAARTGNTERINQVRELLTQVKREIYRLLADS
ncbi:MAG: PadR family transcriptional regulator [Leptolyngbyaceae cyanobacterium bins.302]|nr:PadR family transcriptional regulator [Leptolyngbyaceae cyanobacterium bins.302]